jgi:Flp pilus assembly protein TadB
LARDRIVNYVAGAAVLSSYGLIAQRPASHCIVLAIVGALFAELVSRRADLTRQQKYIRKLEFFIPTVMERVVMAVGAGLDIIPAMKEAAEGADDPASLFLRRVVALTNSGLALEDALESAASGIDCPTLKHLSVHLGLAYRQGGELVRPLRELSDATQLQYQEVEEEEIAKLPVKAVLPLVLTFAGLILCFLTVPLIQVGSIVSKVADVGQQ